VLGQALYDASLGTLPGSQGWGFVAVGPAAETYSESAAQLDTSASRSTLAGYSLVLPAALNRVAGFTLDFTAQLHAETHNNANRAGFSVLALANDKRGIELGFWNGLIFAQADSPLFTHAEDVAFDTTNTFAGYALTIGPTNYVLRANSVPILTGPVRDYTAFNGIINPYRTPNFLFFGDDTTSASASVSLGNIVLVTAPSLTMEDATKVCWSGVPYQTYKVQASTNLVEWTIAGTATAQNASFCFTNSSLAPSRFFKVVYP